MIAVSEKNFVNVIFYFNYLSNFFFIVDIFTFTSTYLQYFEQVWVMSGTAYMCAAMRIQLSESIYDYLVKCEPTFNMVERGLRNVLVSRHTCCAYEC